MKFWIRRSWAVSIVMVMVCTISAKATANGVALDLSAGGAHAGWAGNGTYIDPVVPFNNGGTIEAWLKPVDAPTGLTRVIAASENDYAFVFADAGALGMLLELGPGNHHTYYTPDGVVSLGTWQHVAVSYDLSTLRFYVDGTQVHSTVTVGGPVYGAHNVTLGATEVGTVKQNFVRALLDDVRVWSAVRTEAQIQAAMCEGSPLEVGLVAYWKWEFSNADAVAGIPCPLFGGASYSLDSPACVPRWNDQGNALAGTGGLPKAQGMGGLIVGLPIAVSLDSAKPFAACFLIVGVAHLSAPFKGGVLVPTPDLIFGQTVSFLGKASFGGLWPPGIPSGFTVYFQYWIVDTAGPQGFAASNAVSGTTP